MHFESNPKPTLVLMVFILSLLPVSVSAQERLRPIGHLFSVEGFERDGDGYRITIANHSNRAFTDFEIIVLGTDVNRVTIYRRKIEVNDLMKGQSERTFHLDGTDDRVFRVRIEVFQKPLPERSRREGMNGAGVAATAAIGQPSRNASTPGSVNRAVMHTDAPLQRPSEKEPA